MSLRIDGIVNAVTHFQVFLVADIRLDGDSRGGDDIVWQMKKRSLHSE